jgi:Lrp/AsnC family leucine-responsive transcriptional regulator
MLIEVVFRTTQELDLFIGQLQRFGRTRTQIVFSTSVEHRGVPVAAGVIQTGSSRAEAAREAAQAAK